MELAHGQPGRFFAAAHCVTVAVRRALDALASGDVSKNGDHRQDLAIEGHRGRKNPSKRMLQQPESLSSTLTASPAPPPDPQSDAVAHLAETAQSPEQSPHHVPRWLERVELFLRVMLRMYIGLAICYAPWSDAFWDKNPIIQAYPAISAFAAHGWVRGIVTGLGLLNLWIAFQDAIRHRDS
jgi:hypothetical protein